ncbi:MAG: hypothetical protein AAB373_03085 [Patescibacteria group bacterium]
MAIRLESNPEVLGQLPQDPRLAAALKYLGKMDERFGGMMFDGTPGYYDFRDTGKVGRSDRHIAKHTDNIVAIVDEVLKDRGLRVDNLEFRSDLQYPASEFDRRTVNTKVGAREFGIQDGFDPEDLIGNFWETSRDLRYPQNSQAILTFGPNAGVDYVRGGVDVQPKREFETARERVERMGMALTNERRVQLLKDPERLLTKPIDILQGAVHKSTLDALRNGKAMRAKSGPGELLLVEYNRDITREPLPSADGLRQEFKFRLENA